jgi:CheY-like chemotaxis protein
MILIVDDDRDEREMYMEYLARPGMRVVSASDGATGLEKARQLIPDVVVMDVRMPIMDGLSALKLLQADPATSGIPVVLVSAEDIDDAARAGSCACVRKPCVPRDLRVLITSLVGS